MFQYGLNSIHSMSSSNSGVRVSSALPTMTRIFRSSRTLPASWRCARSMNSGTLTVTKRSASGSGVRRRRSMARAIWRARAAGGTAKASSVALPTTPSSASACRRWKARTASCSVAS